MKRAVLRVLGSGSTDLLRLVWRDGAIDVIEVDPTLKPAVQRWIQEGLVELVGPESDVSQRVTRSNEPHFLSRLADYLGRQSTLNVLLEAGLTDRAPFHRQTLSAASHDKLVNTLAVAATTGLFVLGNAGPIHHGSAEKFPVAANTTMMKRGTEV